MRTTEHPPEPQEHAAEACCQGEWVVQRPAARVSGWCRGLLLGSVHSAEAFKASACLPVLATLAAFQELAVALVPALITCLAERATQPLRDTLLHDCSSDRFVTAVNTSPQHHCQSLQRG